MKLRNKENLIWLVSLGLMMAGCGDKSSPQQAASNVKAALSGQSNQTRDQYGISGNWDSECLKKSIIPEFKAYKEQYHFSGDDGTFNRKKIFYNDENCTEANESFVVQESGTFTFGGNTTPKEGTPINLNFQNAKIQVRNDAAKTILQTINNCGKTDWPVGQDVDVTAQSANFTCFGVKALPSTGFDFVQADDNHLCLGADGEESKGDQRPTAVDRSKVFTKQ